MMLIDSNESNLNRKPRETPLPVTLEVCWDAQVDIALGAARFARNDEVLFFLDGKKSAWRAPPEAIAEKPLNDWDTASDIHRIGAGQGGAIVSREGGVFKWGTTGQPVELWGVEDSIQLFGAQQVSSRHLIVNELVQDKWRWGCVNIKDEAYSWTRDVNAPPQIVPISDDRILVKDLVSPIVKCLDVSGGKEIWSAEVDSAQRIIGIVDDNCWLTTNNGHFVAVSAVTGSMSGQVEIPGVRQTRGVLTPRGEVVLFTGGLLRIVDLDTLRVLRETQMAPREDEPRNVDSDAVILLTNRRIAFTDSTGGLWVHYIDEERTGLIDRCDSGWYLAAVFHDCLIALAKNGTLRCFGAASRVAGA